MVAKEKRFLSLEGHVDGRPVCFSRICRRLSRDFYESRLYDRCGGRCAVTYAPRHQQDYAARCAQSTTVLAQDVVSIKLVAKNA